MCLGIPGKVVEIHAADERGALMGKVDFGGIRKEVCLAYVPEITTGEYVIVHVGFAITQIDEGSAMETLRTFAELGLLDEELGVRDPSQLAAPACPLPSSWSAPDESLAAPAPRGR
jgi:hydrogenase expression/formation protein HypC